MSEIGKSLHRPTRIAILDDYVGCAREVADWSSLEKVAHIEVFRSPFSSTEEAVRQLHGFDVVVALRERTAMPRSFFEGLPRLAAVAMTGRRNHSLDLEAAADHGVTVMRTEEAGGGGNGPVELAWALILAVLRDLPGQAEAVRRGGWQTKLGQSLKGRRLGLIGLGRLGGRMVPVARAFGMDVVAWSPNLTDARAAEEGTERVDLDKLLETSDVVSLHIVLSERTRGLISNEAILRMKPGATLINTSRGGLVDEDALIEALTEGRIRAGLDVYQREPLPADHPLRQTPNTVLTPHIGYCVEERFRSFYEDSIENILAWLAGEPIRVVTPRAG